MKTTFNKTEHEEILQLLFTKMKKGQTSESLRKVYHSLSTNWKMLDKDSACFSVTYTLTFCAWIKSFMLDHFPDQVNDIF